MTMDWLNLLGTALALAMDAFAVSAAISATMSPMTGRQIFRLTWHFGVFQALMPVIGWLGGAAMLSSLAVVDHWIAMGLLWFLGLRMIWQARRPEQRDHGSDPTRGWSLMGLSVATSIDALAVGLYLGLMGIRIWIPSVVIGVVALSLSLTGIFIGRHVGPLLGQWAGRVGGLVLIAIGTRICVQHMMGYS